MCCSTIYAYIVHNIHVDFRQYDIIEFDPNVFFIAHPLQVSSAHTPNSQNWNENGRKSLQWVESVRAMTARLLRREAVTQRQPEYSSASMCFTKFFEEVLLWNESNKYDPSYCTVSKVCTNSHHTHNCGSLTYGSGNNSNNNNKLLDVLRIWTMRCVHETVVDLANGFSIKSRSLHTITNI